MTCEKAQGDNFIAGPGQRHEAIGRQAAEAVQAGQQGGLPLPAPGEPQAAAEAERLQGLQPRQCPNLHVDQSIVFKAVEANTQCLELTQFSSSSSSSSHSF